MKHINYIRPHLISRPWTAYSMFSKSGLTNIALWNFHETWHTVICLKDAAVDSLLNRLDILCWKGVAWVEWGVRWNISTNWWTQKLQIRLKCDTSEIHLSFQPEFYVKVQVQTWWNLLQNFYAFVRKRRFQGKKLMENDTEIQFSSTRGADKCFICSKFANFCLVDSTTYLDNYGYRVL